MRINIILILIFIKLNINNSRKLLKPYLKTTTSEQVENMKAFELKIIKELGKLTPKLRDKEYQSLLLSNKEQEA